MPLRLVALLVALLLTACGDALISSDPPGSTATPIDRTAGPATHGATGNGNGSGDQGGPDGTPTSAAPTPVDDQGRVGANGPAMLRDDRSRIVLEIDIQEGARVDQDAVAYLASIIERYSGKDVVETGGNTFTSSEREWTIAKLNEVVAANRSTFSDAAAVSIHVLYLRGGHHQDGEETNAIGVAWRASQFAMFPDRWAGLGGLVGSDEAIERAVLVHEWGHLLGLVNLTYTSQFDHEDSAHPGHSNNEDSVMFWQVETDLIGQLLGSIPDDFDEADRADMQQIAAGG
ncbi:MAG: hypothetical protein R3249_00875 [Nitriliruptorales bacterium]|nr:hypothetical protein [Nitriliruptorales bacterium]